MLKLRVFAVIAVCSGLAACGDTIGEQALIGSGAGAVTALAVNANPLLGVAAGAAGNVLFCQQFPERC
nr:hypothetical protein [Phaeobacter marinintestinus]